MIQAEHILDGTIVTAEVADGSITEGKLGTGAVTEGKLGTGAVTEGKLGTGAVTEGKLGTGAVTESKLGTGAISTTKIADSAVTVDKSVNQLAGIALNVRPELLACSFSRFSVKNLGLNCVSGTIYVTPIYLTKGTIVTNISLFSAGSAGTSLTHQVVALFNFAGTSKLAESADKLDEAWNTQVEKIFAMQTPYTVPTSGVYLVAMLITASVVPAIHHYGTNAGSILTGTQNGTADTSQTSIPASLDTVSISGNVLLVEIT